MAKRMDKEPFDYLRPYRPVPDKVRYEQFVKMHLDEVRRRTKLLCYLKYDKRQIKKRIKQNIRWEFELQGLPEFYNQVDKLIDQVYEYYRRV